MQLLDGSTGEAPALGLVRLSKLAFGGADLNPIWQRLLRRFVFEPDNADALMDLSIVEQLFGHRDVGVAHQARALQLRQLYRTPSEAAAPSLRLLALAAPGDIGANAPLEFLLDGSAVELMTLYLLPGRPLPQPLPPHDVAIVAIAESAEHRSQLELLRAAKADWPRPLLNAPEHVLALSRERLHRVLAGATGVEIPAAAVIGRQRLAALSEDAAAALLADGGFPLIVRPVDSHAGHGLAKLDTPAAVAPYLEARPESEFILSRFADYRSADGLYRKYRIAFVDGRPYAVHMAITDQWAIWYLNAGMKADAAKRAEEAHFMREFDRDFGRRHRAALAAINDRISLDYFAIDCAESRDGKLLVFEADIAMIVHDMDDPEIYPYKHPQMRRVFGAFVSMLQRRRDSVLRSP